MSDLLDDPYNRRYWGETWAASSYLPHINFSGSEYLSSYQWAIKAFDRLGALPDKCSINGVRGFKSGYWRFWDDNARRRLERSDFEEVKGITLIRSVIDGIISNSQPSNIEYEAWCKGASGSDQNCVVFLLRPRELGVDWVEAKDIFRNFAGIHVRRYGYAYRLAEQMEAGQYGHGGSYGSSNRTMLGWHEKSITRLPMKDPEEAEAGWWLQYSETVIPQILLRNVYMMNFLTEPYLRLEVEGKPLGDWVEAKPKERGTLEKINDTVTLWTPVWEKIPAIRETLFRAGHVFYHRFFQTWEPDNLWARDFYKPWKCPRHIPRIFQSDYQHAIDPPLR